MSVTPIDTRVGTELARFNMIEQQIRPWDVHDAAVLAAMQQVRREEFVPEAYRELAFSDIQIPLSDIGDGNGVMLEPKLVGRMLQALELHPEDRVLQIGAGNGYTSALLSQLASKVTVVEADEARVKVVRQQLGMMGIGNVVVECGDALEGWPGGFDAVLIRGAVVDTPEKWLTQLEHDARLVAVLGRSQPMELMQYRRDADGVTATSVIDTVAPGVVPGRETAPEFVF